jgi:hypothetical protein
MQHLKWQQWQANLPLEPEYLGHNAIACIVQVCFRRLLQPHLQQPKQRQPPPQNQHTPSARLPGSACVT